MGENGWRGRMGREEGKAKGEIPILTQSHIMENDNKN